MAALVIAVGVGLWVARRWNRFRSKRRMKRLRKLGRRGERQAGRLLKRAGYRVEQWQVSVQTVVRCDGEDVPIRVQADALVTKGGRRYVAEIKGGPEAAKLTNRTTRRQLMEYAVAFGHDTVVLVDAHNERVHTVQFPSLKS